MGSEWISELRPGDRVFVGSSCGEPLGLVTALVDAAQVGLLPPVTVYQMLTGSSLALLGAAQHGVRLVAITCEPSVSRLIEDGMATFLPMSIFQIARGIADGGLRFDVCLLEVSSPNSIGQAALGVSVDFAAQVVKEARLVVVEVNDKMPRTLGHEWVDLSLVHVAGRVSRAIPEIHSEVAAGDVAGLASNVLELVPDGATIELGVGGVMGGVADGLAARRDLGIHTGLLTDALARLIQSGAVTNTRKGVDYGVSVANQCRGCSGTYTFADGNPTVALRPASYTHDPDVLRSLRCFRAINSAIEVDLMGRVNSEFRDGHRVSSSGGLTDFVQACRRVGDARSIVALRATALHGRVSRVVPDLGKRGHETLSADLADLVVTDFGVADLRNLNGAERVSAMLEVASPEFRADLSGRRSV